MLATSVNDFCRFDPAVAGDDHPGILVDDVVFLAELDVGGRALDPRPRAVAVALGDLLELARG